MCEVQLQGTPDDRTKVAEQRLGKKKEVKPAEYTPLYEIHQKCER